MDFLKFEKQLHSSTFSALFYMLKLIKTWQWQSAQLFSKHDNGDATNTNGQDDAYNDGDNGGNGWSFTIMDIGKRAYNTFHRMLFYLLN